MSLNTYDSLTIIGKVGKDAECRYLPNGNAITSFSVAVDRSYKKDNEWVKRTIWYRISVFGKLAEICQKVKKGDTIMIGGELQADWTNGAPRIYSKQDGTSGTSFEVTAQTVRFLSSPRDGGMVEEAIGQGGRVNPFDDGLDDSIIGSLP